MDISTFQDLLSTWGYLLLFLYSLGGGYVGIIAASFLSGMGSMDIILSIATASSGNFTGSQLLSFLTRFQKASFRSYLKKHQRKLALSQIWLAKYGVALIFGCKYLYGIKTIVPISIGLSKYDLKRFAFWNLLSSALWGILIGMSGYFATDFIKQIFDKLTHLPAYAMPLIVLALVGVLVFSLRYYSGKNRKIKENNEKGRNILRHRWWQHSRCSRANRTKTRR